MFNLLFVQRDKPSNDISDESMKAEKCRLRDVRYREKMKNLEL